MEKTWKPTAAGIIGLVIYGPVIILFIYAWSKLLTSSYGDGFMLMIPGDSFILVKPGMLFINTVIILPLLILSLIGTIFVILRRYWLFALISTIPVLPYAIMIWGAFLRICIEKMIPIVKDNLLFAIIATIIAIGLQIFSIVLIVISKKEFGKLKSIHPV
jgi:hypothetical protein